MMADELSGAIVVFMTAPTREEAARLAEMLVGARLAACVQILPEMESIYRWDDSVQRDAEFLIIAKSTAGCFADLAREVRALHSYTVPQIIAVPACAVSSPYLEWLVANVNSPGRAHFVAEAGVAAHGE